MSQQIVDRYMTQVMTWASCSYKIRVLPFNSNKKTKKILKKKKINKKEEEGQSFTTGPHQLRGG